MQMLAEVVAMDLERDAAALMRTASRGSSDDESSVKPGGLVLKKKNSRSIRQNAKHHF
jgi:hypothetical protein